MQRPKFVAELTINHLGMRNIARAMIDEAKKAGADFVKMKIKKVDKYYSDSQKSWREFDFKTYRGSLELSEDDFRYLDQYCRSIGMQWFSTIHDRDGLDFVRQFSPPMYKVASMDVEKDDLVDDVIGLCRQENKPLVISMGGKSDDFLEATVQRILDADIQAHILHTVSVYPTPVGRCNINYLKAIIERYKAHQDQISFGYSGHESDIGPSLLAASYGARMIERHVTMSKEFQIHHIGAAISFYDFAKMVNLIEQMAGEANQDVREVDAEENRFLKDRVYL